MENKNLLNKASTVAVVATVGVLVSLSGVLGDTSLNLNTAFGYGNNNGGSVSNGTNAFTVEDNSAVTTGDETPTTKTQKEEPKKEEPKKEEPKKEEPKKEEPKEEPKGEEPEAPAKDRVVKVFGKDKVYTIENKTCSVSSDIAGTTDVSDFMTKFSDIKGVKFEEAIKILEKNNVVKGTTPTTFEPKKDISRAEFLAIVLISHCYDVHQVAGKTPFSDLEVGDWKNNVVAVALENGIISGDKNASGERVFRPNDAISKIEAMAIMTAMRDIQVPESFKHSYKDAAASWQNKVLNTTEYLELESKSDSFNPNAKVDRATMSNYLVKTVRLY